MGAPIGNGPVHLQRYGYPPQKWMAQMPQDWQAALRAMYDYQCGSLECLILKNDGEITVGGILCSGMPLDMLPYEDMLTHAPTAAWRYIGFLWTSPNCRKKGWASKWLQCVKQHLQSTVFWLSVEDPALIPFYVQNGFQVVQALYGAQNTEWVLVQESANDGR